MSKFPHGGDALGAQPGHLLLAPVLRPEMVLSRQQALLDLQAIQRIPGLAGYWPADPAYLYEDSAGMIPASVEGVVGAVTALNPTYTLGSEINTTPTTWTVQAEATNNGDGSYTFNATTAARSFYKSYGTFSGFLRVAFTVSGVTSASIRFAYRGAYPHTAVTANGDYVFNVLAGTSGDNSFYVEAFTGSTATISNLSIKQVTSNSAYQATTTKKPILRRTPTSNVYWLNSDTDDELTATLGNLGSACTVARSGAEGVTFTEGVTISSTYNIAPAYGFNGDVAIFNRALTASEKALLTRYMARGVPVLSAEMLENSSLNDLSGWSKLPTGSVDVTLENHAISILTSVAANVGIATAIPTNSALLFSCVFSNRSGQSLPTYIRVGSNASNVDGTDIMPINAVKTDNTKLIFNNGSAGFIKLFTTSFADLAFTLSSPSVRKIL